MSQRAAADSLAVFSRNLRSLRHDRGLSILDVAIGSGVSNAVIGRAENGGGVHLRSAVALTRFFGVRLDDLLKESR